MISIKTFGGKERYINKMDIIFTDTVGLPDGTNPGPASKNIPDWYKNLESYAGGEKKPDGNGGVTTTIKKCMPVFDAITGGYILYTHTDVFVSQKREEIDGPTYPFYEWVGLEPITFHPLFQAPTHPNSDSLPYPKWMNPWSIKTPKGYSCLFVQPLHRESIFTILPGIVDTDNYTAPVNFPFVLNDPKFEGLIPAGTPMAQVIPFKRDKWKMSFGNEETFKEQHLIKIRIATKFFDKYKNLWWQRKEYK